MSFVLRVTDGRQATLASPLAVSQAVDAISAVTGGSSLRGNLSGLFGLGFAPLDDAPITPETADILQREALESLELFGSNLDEGSRATLNALAGLSSSE